VGLRPLRLYFLRRAARDSVQRWTSSSMAVAGASISSVDLNRAGSHSKVKTGLMVAPDRESAIAVFSSANG
jgi:hypothetical protein